MLSRINGQWDVKSIMKISPMKELEVLMIFQQVPQGRRDSLEEVRVSPGSGPRAGRHGRLGGTAGRRFAPAGAVLSALLRASGPDPRGERWPELVFFTALGVLAFRLRIRYGANYVGVEAAALIPAILASPLAGRGDARPASSTDAISKLLGAAPETPAFPNSFDIAQLAISYAAAALFCQGPPFRGRRLG